MSAQEWQCIRKHIPNFIMWPEFMYGCLAGACCGVILLETIIRTVCQ